MKYLIIIIITALLLASCQEKDDHGHEHSSGEVHANDEGGMPSADTTVWTDNLELFTEYPALTVDRVSRFNTHLTLMEGHKPLESGSVTVSLIKNGKGIRNTAESPSSAGIFTPALKPKEAGMHKLVFDIKTSDFSERIVIENVRVFESAEAASKALAKHEENADIEFLKEQAWKMDFQTVHVTKQEIYEIINTHGLWKPAPGETNTVTASSSGIAKFSKDDLTEGKTVRHGEVLIQIISGGLTSNNLKSDIAEAEAAFQQAKSEFEKDKKLHDSGIVSGSELEKSRKKYLVAQSKLETLKKGYSKKGKSVKVPFSGYIKKINVDNGDFVREGDPLFTVITGNSRLLKTHVPQSYSDALESIKNIYYKPGKDKWSSLLETGGNLVSVSKTVNKEKPMIEVYAKVNEKVNMPEGAFTETQIAIGSPKKSITIPESALLEDYGSYSVIVQLSGENFERRTVSPGRNNGSYFEILDGLTEGEIVVTKGAYQVKMASMKSNAPAHGHVH